jgi:peptidase M28-like protein
MPRRTMRHGAHLVLAIGTLGASHLSAQEPIQAAALRTRLYALAADSMMGRDPGTRGNLMATDYVAAEFKRFGLVPKGDAGTWFQVLPLGRVAADSGSWVEAGGTRRGYGDGWIVLSQQPFSRDFPADAAVYGGLLNDPATWIGGDRAQGKVVVLGLAPDAPPRGVRTAAADPRLREAAAIATVLIDRFPPGTIAQIGQGSVSLGAPTEATVQGPLTLIVSRAVAEQMMGRPLEGLAPGDAGATVRGRVKVGFQPFALPARNVVAMLPGSDPRLRAEYVTVTAHNDHVGVQPVAVDHDSMRAFNRVVRPMGADSPIRPATADEEQRISAIRDSLRAVHPPRADSVLNGADDDGTGTVALLEIARTLARNPRHPRRSIVFVSHTAEERGLLGSQWFTDHPTVPREAIVAEIDMDMIGRGDPDDLPKGGPGYLEVVGSRRLSTEFGDTLEAVNARQPLPFTFNYEFDAPGHPLQYYCRADHYSYARYGIPATALSRGEHLDYHQVTDEPQYIDYEALARVARLVRDMAVTVGNMDHRPKVDGPVGDPKAGCRQ